MNNIFWFDLETTGTDKNKHAIIQIACMVTQGKEVLGTFESKIHPLQGKIIDDKALEINGITRDEINMFPKPEEVWKDFRCFCSCHGIAGSKIDRFIPAGYNVAFDLDFFNVWHNEMGGKYAFWDYLQYQPIDPYPVLVSLWRSGIIKTENCKLETMCKFFDIEIKAHDAMSDIMATRKLSQKIFNPINKLFTGIIKDIQQS